MKKIPKPETLKRFEPNQYYPANDSSLHTIATPGTLSVWRHEGRGPRYVKLGGKILYLGSDLNYWLDERVVEPAAA